MISGQQFYKSVPAIFKLALSFLKNVEQLYSLNLVPG
jgi:hypothetical protein